MTRKAMELNELKSKLNEQLGQELEEMELKGSAKVSYATKSVVKNYMKKKLDEFFDIDKMEGEIENEPQIKPEEVDRAVNLVEQLKVAFRNLLNSI